MKLDLKKIGHNRDLWIVIGGAAAAVTAVAVLAGGRGKAASSSTTDPYAQLPGGGSTSPDPVSVNPHFGADPILTAPSPHVDPAAFTPYTAPAPVKRAPAVAPPIAPTFVNAKGAPATIAQIMAQVFPVAQSTNLVGLAPVHSAPVSRAPTPTMAADRFGNRMSLADLIASFSTPGPGSTEASPSSRLTAGFVENPLVTPSGGAYPNTIAFIGPNLPNQGSGTPGEGIGGPMLTA